MTRIAVIGSGYVGLVSAACFAEIGHQVISVDNDSAKIAALERGETPIHEQRLPELLARHKGGRLRFSTSEIGHQVISVDNDSAKIAALERGETPIHEQRLPELLARHKGGRLRFSTS